MKNPVVEKTAEMTHSIRSKVWEMRRQIDACSTVTNVLVFAAKTDANRYGINLIVDELDRCISEASADGNERLVAFLESARRYATSY